MGDRSGGREPKGSSLKKSKKNPGAPAAKVKKQPKVAALGPATSLPPPPPGNELYFDCGAALLSRQFDRDRERMLIRAKTEGNCGAVITWFSDIEKQQALADLCKVNSGFCYFVTGIHPDNIDGTNKKAHDTWLERSEELARRPECVGILSGLNLSREMKTHFAQEQLLKQSFELADKLLLPVILHIPDGLERSLEIFREAGWTDDEAEGRSDRELRVVIHDAITASGGNADRLSACLAAGWNCSLSAAALTDPDQHAQSCASACVAAIPVERILVCSDAPWKTPQNLPDVYLRTLRNEPSNVPFIVDAIANAKGISNILDLAGSIRKNSCTIFGLEYLDEEAVRETMQNLSVQSTAITPIEDVKEKEKTNSTSKQSKLSRDKEILSNVESLIEQQHGDQIEKGVSTSNDTQQVADLKESNSSNIGAYYGCIRCRLRLFSLEDVTTHGLDTARAVFKSGEQGLCKATIFLRCHDSKEIAQRSGIIIRGSNAECSECGSKLGKYSVGEAFCACGASVTGPTVRIQAIKTDFFDTSLNAEQLVARSLLEAEESQRDALLEEEDSRNKGKKKKIKKNLIRSDKTSNFSNYRNKTFKRVVAVSKTTAEDNIPTVVEIDEEDEEYVSDHEQDNQNANKDTRSRYSSSESDNESEDDEESEDI